MLKQEILLESEVIWMFLTRLKHLPMNFERVALTIRQMQYVARLLHALVDYMQIYKPRMDGQADIGVIRKVTDRTSLALLYTMPAHYNNFVGLEYLSGAFIRLQRWLYIGWMLCHESTDLVGCVWTKPQLKLRSVYTGAATKAKYEAMERFTQDHLGWVDPFTLTTPIILTRSNAPLPLSTRVDICFSPCEFDSSNQY